MQPACSPHAKGKTQLDSLLINQLSLNQQLIAFYFQNLRLNSKTKVDARRFYFSITPFTRLTRRMGGQPKGGCLYLKYFFCTFVVNHLNQRVILRLSVRIYLGDYFLPQLFCIWILINSFVFFIFMIDNTNNNNYFWYKVLICQYLLSC